MSYIFLTIFFTVYGQFIIKWQVMNAGSMPESFMPKMLFLFHLVLNPWVISGFLAAFLASLAWMAALTKLPLSSAYPFMSLTFVLVIFFSGIFFSEAITALKIIGVALILLGVTIGSKG